MRGEGRVGGVGGEEERREEGRVKGEKEAVLVGGENGKLGTTSEGFPQYNKSGPVKHECELPGEMT